MVYLNRYVSTQCQNSVCATTISPFLAGSEVGFPMLTAGMALLCVSGICSIACLPLTLLKQRPQGLPQANWARVALSAVALVTGIFGVLLVRSDCFPFACTSTS
jgi:hypothetical protein